MKSLLSAGILITLLSVHSVVAATFSIPMEFEYIAIDGKPIKTNSFKHKAKLTITAGQHKIALRYKDLIRENYSDSETFVQSSPFIVTLTTSKNSHYELVPKGNQISDPKNYAKAPKINIISSDNKSINYTVTHTNVKESSFIGRLFNGQDNHVDPKVLATELTSLTPKNTQNSSIQMPSSVNSSHINNTPASATQSAKMLQYWWQQADPQTQKEFMSWAIKQL